MSAASDHDCTQKNRIEGIEREVGTLNDKVWRGRRRGRRVMRWCATGSRFSVRTAYRKSSWSGGVAFARRSRIQT